MRDVKSTGLPLMTFFAIYEIFGEVRYGFDY